MKIVSVHAHFDDFEFVAGGTFELFRRKKNAQLKVVVCTDGKAGHHCRTRDETGRLRLEEQKASAEIGHYEFELLKLPDGKPPREACLQVTTGLLAGLWKCIRDFEPDYIFCPPYPSDPLAGIHVDHWAVAEAVRKVAYMINVPHAFTPEYPADETRSRPCKVPVIVSVFDPYMFGANSFDLAVDVEEVFPHICRLTYCHQSQISEWLPWVARHDIQAPQSPEDWAQTLRRRFRRQNKDLGISEDRPIEVFNITAWGEVPAFEQLLADFPNVMTAISPLEKLQKRLRVWRGE